jgi:DNA polymerase-3 subunit epsilon
MWPLFRRRAAGLDARLAAQPPAAARYVVIDTELTGLEERRDSIVSLGALRVADGRIDLADRFYEEVQPASALTAESILLHGITPQQVRDRPAIGSVLGDFAAFCGADILVGHFIDLDLGFLRRELAQAGLPAIANPALDTWPLYDWMSGRGPAAGDGLPRLKDPRLPELARALGIPCDGGHNALTDAYVTAQVFQRLLRRLERWGITTAGQLLRTADPRQATRWRREATAPLA